MAYFYSTIRGNRGQASRCGSKSSGLSATANSYTVGAEVHLEYSDTLDADVVTIYSTRGSNGSRSRMLSYAVKDNKLIIIDTNYPELLI